MAGRRFLAWQIRVLFSLVLGFDFCISFDHDYVLKTAAVSTLDGEWTVTNRNQSIVTKAIVPGGIYTDLMRAGIIGDPYYRNNDVLYKWIGRDDWTFSRTFEVDCEILQKSRVILVFHGLDTISRITLNGKVIGTTRNMFIRYTFDVKDLLQADNNISISFRSAVNYAADQHRKQVQNYVIPPTCPPPAQNGECHVNYIRKVQSSFSWDWGPSFPTQGIWKHTEVVGFNFAIIRDITVTTERLSRNGNAAGDRWRLRLKLFLDSATVDSRKAALAVYLDGTLIESSYVPILPSDDLSANLSLSIDVPDIIDIRLWWPNGLGEQSLYNLTILLGALEEKVSKTIRIGFRTLELVQEPVQNSSGGASFREGRNIAFYS